MSDVYYNEFDRFCCSWLKELAADGAHTTGAHRRAGHPVPSSPMTCGTTRSATSLLGESAAGPNALRLAGWPDDMPVCTKYKLLREERDQHN